MISKCLNPGCSARFTKFGTGDVYVLERHVEHKVEFFWLCPECLQRLTVGYLGMGGVGVVPKTRESFLPPPRIESDLRLAFRHKGPLLMTDTITPNLVSTDCDPRFAAAR